MWGYQHYFCSATQFAAERLFLALDPRFTPKMYLVGFLDEQREDRHQICVEPDHDCYKPDLFTSVKGLAEHLQTVGNGMVYSHPSQAVAERFKERDRRSYLQRALTLVLGERESLSGVISFCGRPERVEGFLVVPVLQLNKAVYEALPALSRDHQIGERILFSPSLVEAAVKAFLQSCSKALGGPQPGAEFESICSNEMETLRQAAASFMLGISSVGHEPCELYAVCNGFSSLPYEGIEGVGRLIISRRSHPDIDVMVELLKPVGLRDYRAVRKLLEISESGQSLLSDSSTVYGLGRVLPSYNASLQNIFEIEITGHYQWRILHADQTLMEVTYDKPHLPKSRLSHDNFYSTVRRLFPSTQVVDLDNLWRLVNAAINQRHGTMLVISVQAQSEIERLSRQSTPVTPFTLTPEIMRSVSKIDGAVLVDPHGICVGIGVILDGLASAKGAPGRGARYNSAIRYTDTVLHKTLAIVVSQDGSVDLVPDLKPQIDRKEIDSHLKQLSVVQNTEQLDMRQFYALMNWFSRHKFYLLPDVCQQINEIKQAVYARHQAISSDMFIVENDFEPDSTMNDEYFLSTEKPESN
ncbi:MAG: DNA integrity scanning protein DisA nucleotide-binding domain protein [Phycisphaerae bacterium]